MIPLFLALTLCGTPSDPGFVMYDGSCMTISRYNESFSAEALGQIPSFVDPDRSVADVYDLDPTLPAADRPIGVGLVEVPFTFRQMIHRWTPV